MKSKQKFTVLIERDEEGYFVATVPALRGCHTQAKNLDTLMKRVQEVIELCLEVEGPSFGFTRVGGNTASRCMTKLPRIKAKDLIRALRRAGFQLVRIRGSHHFLQHSNGRVTSVPVHSGEIIGPGLLATILRDIEMTSEEFSDLL